MRVVVGAMAVIAGCVAISGCDSFFVLEGEVTRCTDDEPLVGVRAELPLRDGISEAEVNVDFTDPDGHFQLVLNEPSGVAATLILTKPTYETRVLEYDESPEGLQTFCLQPAIE